MHQLQEQTPEEHSKLLIWDQNINRDIKLKNY